MINQRQLNSISQLNVLMQNNEVFRTSITIDATVRNKYNITQSIKIIELYSYLYKHCDMLGDIFKTNSDGEINLYLGHRVITFLHSYMVNNMQSPAQAIKELKRVRNASDYKGELG